MRIALQAHILGLPTLASRGRHAAICLATVLDGSRPKRCRKRFFRFQYSRSLHLYSQVG